ncbi:tail fiber domain-containing protein, partial [Escherichia coli]
ASGQIFYAGPLGAGSFQQVPASDRNIKHSIKDDESSIAYNNIKSMRFRNFIFNDDEQERVRRGVIAQEIEEIDNLYVKRRVYESHELNGPKVERLELDTTPLLLDTMRALQDTIKKVEELQEEIKMLKSK